MAASDPHQHSDRLSSSGAAPTPTDLLERLHEEIARAERHRTGLSCLLVVLEDLEEMAREHGGELREQTIEYVVGALRGELRCFDRVGRSEEGEVIVLLPGADSPHGEIVARRALERLHAIKVESEGTRSPLQVSVGLAAWREGVNAQGLLARARGSLRSVNGHHSPMPPVAPGGAAVPIAGAPPQ